ncbi:MAG: MCE family protein [Betaproteobacteria bacterium]|nr:MCE family protein [Betaproteobacteria bacterium]
MESRAHAIIAGLFTVLLGAGVILAAVWFSRDDFANVTYVLQSRYDVQGLNPQAPVKLRGVQIGKVQSIDFDSEDPSLILVTISVRGGSRITRGTTAQLGALGITGTSYVNLEDDGKLPAFLPPSTDKSDRIMVRRSLLDEFAVSGQEILFEATKALRQMQALLSDASQKQFVDMFASVQNAAQRVNQMASAVEPGAKSLPAVANDARKLLAGADAALRDVGPVLQDAKTALAGIDKLAREYAQRADVLDRVAKSAEQLGGATQGLAGTANAFAGDVAPRMNLLLDDLARTSRNLDRLLAELSERPQGLVFGRPSGRPGPGEAGFVEPSKK